MANDFVATSTISIDAPADRVWSVLTDRDAIKEFMFGTEVETDWTVGGPIAWHGVWKGAPYEDHGVIVELEPGRRLVNTHFSPLSGEEDVPENSHTMTWTLDESGGTTVLTLSQDNNGSDEGVEHSKRMWDDLVRDVKAIAERDA